VEKKTRGEDAGSHGQPTVGGKTDRHEPHRLVKICFVEEGAVQIYIMFQTQKETGVWGETLTKDRVQERGRGEEKEGHQVRKGGVQGEGVGGDQNKKASK